jgi:hypothetical protein
VKSIKSGTIHSLGKSSFHLLVRHLLITYATNLRVRFYNQISKNAQPIIFCGSILGPAPVARGLLKSRSDTAFSRNSSGTSLKVSLLVINLEHKGSQRSRNSLRTVSVKNNHQRHTWSRILGFQRGPSGLGKFLLLVQFRSEP